MKEQYVISALRNVCFVCEKDNNVYIGNVNVKVFDSKSDANKFLKTKVIKSKLNEYIPLIWFVTNIKEIKGE